MFGWAVSLWVALIQAFWFMLPFIRKTIAKDLEWIAKKIVGLRIFDDKNDRMNLPIANGQGILVVSQFTLSTEI